MDDGLRETVTEARLRLKAGRGLIRDLLAAVTRLEEALDRFDNAQPEEAQRDHEKQDRSERLCVA